MFSAPNSAELLLLAYTFEGGWEGKGGWGYGRVERGGEMGGGEKRGIYTNSLTFFF